MQGPSACSHLRGAGTGTSLSLLFLNYLNKLFCLRQDYQQVVGCSLSHFFQTSCPWPHTTPEVCETALLIRWKPLPRALTDAVAFQEALQGMDNPMFRLGEGTEGSGQGAERLPPKLIH